MQILITFLSLQIQIIIKYLFAILLEFGVCKKSLKEVFYLFKIYNLWSLWLPLSAELLSLWLLPLCQC